MSTALVVRVLQPWFENIGKRQTKAPKVYVRDTSLLHALLNIADLRALNGHPKLGASWESFVIEQVLNRTGERSAYHWRTQAGAELDLLLHMPSGRRIGIEVQYSDAPAMSKSMHAAMNDFGLSRLVVVYPGSTRFPLAPRVEAMGLADCLDELG